MAAKDSPPASKADVAAVAKDLAVVAKDLAVVAKDLNAKISTVAKGLNAKIDAVEQRLDAKIDGVEKRLDAKIDGVIVELVKTQGAMESMEGRLTSLIREESRKTNGTIDSFLANLETYSRESFTLPQAIDQHGETLRGHEAKLGEHDRRLRAVEARP